MLYREEIIQTAKTVAGFSDTQADNLVKAVCKKRDLDTFRGIFLDGCKSKGVVTDNEAIEIFEAIEKSPAHSLAIKTAIDFIHENRLSR